MNTFKNWLYLETAQTEEEWARALGNYVGQIVRFPKLSDIETWVSLMKTKLSPRVRKGLLLDMINAIDKAIGKLPPEQQDQADLISPLFLK